MTSRTCVPIACGSLPNVLLLEVFQFCTTSEQVVLLKVCRLWRSLTQPVVNKKLEKLEDSVKPLYLLMRQVGLLQETEQKVLKDSQSLRDKWANTPFFTACRMELTEIPLGICLFSNIQVLDLSANKLTSLPSAIGRLGELFRLSVDDNPSLTSLPVEAICGLKKLQRLAIKNTAIPQAQIDVIRQKLPGCTVVVD
jgi:hypothetical protein